MGWCQLIELNRCPPDQGVFIQRRGLELAVFRLTDPPGAAVIDNTCPHAGGNLSGGKVENGVVTCPWHEWPFDLITGRCVYSDKAAVRRYRTEIRDGAVWADL